MRGFTHINATTVDEASSAKADNGTILAGGTDVLGMEKDFVLSTSAGTMVNIKTIPDLNNIADDGGLKIGALATLTDIAESSVVNSKWSSLAEGALKVGTPQLRNMGTIAGNLAQECRCWYYRAHGNFFNCLRKGGNLCFATIGNNTFNAILGGQACFAVAASDTAIPLTALDATVVTNQRSMPIGDLFVVLGNTLGDDEIITEIQVPAPAAGTIQAFKKYARRKSFDFACASAAVSITVSGGNVSECKIALGGVAPVPWRASAAEDELTGGPVNATTAAAAAAKATDGSFVLPNNGWLISVTRAMVERAILAAV
ncbi:FAD binding domain-containing protein [Chloroflexota bacterium]